jgi:glycosyltransferase involved in cell wall biosynthesis
VDLASPAQAANGGLFRRAAVAVSPSTHDGTPNTLLEAMACGCFPVAGDLESLREWINPDVNGLLVDPGDPHALADAILTALEHSAAPPAVTPQPNLIAERAEHTKVMAGQKDFRSIWE